MRMGKEAAVLGTGLMLVLVVAGCGGPIAPPLASPLDARQNTPGQRPLTGAPDLRIPGDALASAGDIPVVPVPYPLDRPTAAPSVIRASAPPTTPIVPAAMQTPAAAPPAPAATGIDNMRRLYRLAAERYERMDSYISRLTRREMLRGDMKETEVILFKFRKQPFSLYFKWLGTNGAGREVIYVKGQYEDKIHSLLAAGDMPLAPAGKRMALSPDSIFVRNASRHPITEAGVGASLERIGKILEAMTRSDNRLGTLTDLGLIERPEFARPVAAIEQAIPEGQEAELPRGGRRLYCFDPDNNLPVLLSTRDPRGQEVEYYFYDRIQFPVRLDDNDFNPDKLWAKQAPRKP